MESLPEIYSRLSRDGWAGPNRAKFDQLDPFPKVGFRLVDGFDLLGAPVEEFAPWFKLSADARAVDCPETTEASLVTFTGEGSSFLAALGNLLEDIDRRSGQGCVWPENPFTEETGEEYVKTHPLFGKKLALCARFGKRSILHPEKGCSNVHAAWMSPYRGKAMVHDPFLSSAYGSTREELYRELAYRIWLAYGNQDHLPAGISLYFSNGALKRENLYERAGFCFEGAGVSFRFTDGDAVIESDGPGIFENHMLLLEKYVLASDRRRKYGSFCDPCHL